ncbi:MAG: hypothetical protein ABIS43_03970 [Opitutus sp.]
MVDIARINRATSGPVSTSSTRFKAMVDNSMRSLGAEGLAYDAEQVHQGRKAGGSVVFERHRGESAPEVFARGSLL